MQLGIKLTVDFAFKKVFGSPEYSAALIGLLNAILGSASPIVAVEILNPFSYQEFKNDKLVVLDIRAQDQNGNWYNIEMQVSNHPGLLQRLVFYAGKLYTEQLGAGDYYTSLRPAISICLLEHRIFHDSLQAHHHFVLIDEQSGRRIAKSIEVHTIELPKYNLGEGTIPTAEKLEQWVFLLLRAQDYEAQQLRELLPAVGFQAAISGLEIISFKTEDRAMYDQREKAQRDFQWMIDGAKTQAKAEGKAEGREEGKLGGKIQILQELLGDPVLSDAELMARPTSELTALLATLQRRLRARDA